MKQTTNKIQHDKIQANIETRYRNFRASPKSVLDSIMDRQKETIHIDKVKTNINGQDILITDEEELLQMTGSLYHEHLFRD